VPAAAVPDESVKVALPPAVTEAGLNEAVAPAGTPEALRLTVCATPEVTAVETELLPLPPLVTATLTGLAAIEKSSTTTALTTNESVAVCVAEAPVPVTVMR
jgi:hypothetical protein